MRAAFCPSVLLLSSLSACIWPFGSDAPPTELIRPDLYQHWVHSREEESENDRLQVFRPANYQEIPPSWFRMEYVFDSDGTCRWMFLAPDDGHHLKQCTWRLEGNDLHIQQEDVLVSYRVVELREDLLRLLPSGE